MNTEVPEYEAYKTRAVKALLRVGTGINIGFAQECLGIMQDAVGFQGKGNR